MKATRRPRLTVEHLERRECPVASVSLAGDTLFVFGAVIPNDTANGGLQITGTGNNLLSVQDGTHKLGTYRADNLDLLLTSHTSSDIRIDLSGNNLNGNVLISLGAGDTAATGPTYNEANGIFITNGRIGGNVTVVGGSGDETLFLGTKLLTGVTPTSDGPLTIGGSVNYSGRSSNNATNASGAPTGNQLDTGTNYPGPMSPVVTIGGSINMQGVELGIGANTTVGQNVTITIPPPVSLPGLVTINGKIEGNFTYNGPTTDANVGGFNFGDLITVAAAAGSAAPTIGGNFSATLANAPVPGAGNVTLSTGVTVDGNLTLAGGTNNSLDVAGAAVNGNATLRGNGVVSYEFDTGSSVSGNLSIVGDNGTHTQVAPFTGTVGGNVNVQMGNGANGPWTFAPTGGNGYGGQLNWTSGNGTDSVAIGSPGFYQLNVQFGNNDDTFTGSLGALLAGNVNGGGRLIGNVFNQNGSTILPNFTLSNFP